MSTVFIRRWPSNHSADLAGSRIELGTKHESLFKVLNENAHFGGHPAACRPYGKDWHCSLKGSQKPDDGTFPEFCGEEPCRRLGNSQVFQDTHPHLFNIARTKDPCGDNTLHVLSRAKAPRLYGTSLDKNDRPKAVEIVRRLRRAMSGQVLRSRDENDHRLRESSRNQSGVW